MRDPHATLSCLAEEASEIIKEAMKIHRFGPHSYHPADPSTNNVQLLTQEIGDLLAVVQVLVEETGYGITYDALTVAKQRKLAKLDKFLPKTRIGDRP